MKTRKSNLILFLILILVIPSFTCTSQTPKSDYEQSTEQVDSPGEDSVSDTGESTPPDTTGDEIEFGKTTAYQDVFGYWNIHGLLINTADYAVGSAEIEVNLLDENDTPVETETFFAAPNGIAPGDTQPFSFRLSGTVTSLDHYEFNVLQLKRVEMDPVQLESSGMSITESENGIVSITGEVQNNSDQPAAIYSIKAALFSAAGEIITTESCQVCTRYLDPGDSGPFQFLIFGHPSEAVVDHYEIYFSVETAAHIEGFEITFSEQIHAYTDPAGNFHILGDIQNSGNQILDLRLLATFYDQNQQIVGASAYDLPLNSLVPGESSPYDILLLEPLDAVVDWSIQVDLAGSRVVDSPSFVLSTTGDEDNITEYLSTFSGQVVNDTGETLNIVLVVIGLREKSTGRLAGLSYSLLTGEFPAGSTVEYNLTISPDTEIDTASLEKFILTRGR